LVIGDDWYPLDGQRNKSLVKVENSKGNCGKGHCAVQKDGKLVPWNCEKSDNCNNDGRQRFKFVCHRPKNG